MTRAVGSAAYGLRGAGARRGLFVTAPLRGQLRGAGARHVCYGTMAHLHLSGMCLSLRCR
eukprot:4171411-Prymnesium_polylepis.2